MILYPRIFRDAYEVLRSPDRQPKCYDMTETERATAVTRLNRNVWNNPVLIDQDLYGVNK